MAWVLLLSLLYQPTLPHTVLVLQEPELNAQHADPIHSYSLGEKGVSIFGHSCNTKNLLSNHHIYMHVTSKDQHAFHQQVAIHDERCQNSLCLKNICYLISPFLPFLSVFNERMQYFICLCLTCLRSCFLTYSLQIT